eukprot:TRINITY_DN27589_c0_g1_i1.p1 TRINITY_DN27589_c0_g1~~TRINITY_DN27589_c0_g1_i1.p1  ORF type:complete len:578 (+),score=186.20 TRINITY_DN27589_c0_g1_i1:116-1849(+)
MAQTEDGGTVGAPAAKKGAALRDAMRQALSKQTPAEALSGDSTSSRPTKATAPSKKPAGFAPAPRNGAAAEKGDALKAKMKGFLLSKKKDEGKGREDDEAVVLDENVLVEDDDIDPWPEIRLGANLLGVEDGRQRADELRRRGDFEAHARMMKKVYFLSRHSTQQGKHQVTAHLVAELAVEYAEALILAEDWLTVVRHCNNASEATRQTSTTFATRLLCHRARARVELSNGTGTRIEAARADISEALSLELNGMDDGMDFVQAQSAAVEERIKEIAAMMEKKKAEEAEAAQEVAEARRRQAQASSQQPMAAGGRAAYLASAERKAMEEAVKDGRGAGGDAEADAWNQAFFDRMEKEYDQMCEKDGWEEIRQMQDELNGGKVATAEEIPADSDYFKVRLPAGAVNRELRPGSEGLPQASKELLEELARKRGQKPAGPRRNLDELRRVERETQEAIEREQRMRAAAGPSYTTARAGFLSREIRIEDLGREEEDAADPGSKEAAVYHPGTNGGDFIRTKSDVVRIDSLDDSEDGSVKDLTEAEAEKVKEQAKATFDALKEFDRLGRLKDERLARWRERWG